MTDLRSNCILAYKHEPGRTQVSQRDQCEVKHDSQSQEPQPKFPSPFNQDTDETDQVKKKCEEKWSHAHLTALNNLPGTFVRNSVLSVQIGGLMIILFIIIALEIVASDYLPFTRLQYSHAIHH